MIWCKFLYIFYKVLFLIYRVFYFFHGGKEKLYISSADWMSRNLDHRSEVAVPITDEVIKKQILNILKNSLKKLMKFILRGVLFGSAIFHQLDSVGL